MKEILLGLTKHNLFDKYKLKLKPDSFSDKTIRALFQTLTEAHNKSNQDITLSELKALHFALNPTITLSAKANLEHLFDELSKIELSDTIAEELILTKFKSDKFIELAALAIDGGDNKPVDLIKLQEILVDIQSTRKEDEYEFVTDDIEELFKELEKEYRWKIHFDPLAEHVTGIGEGVFGLIAARPNAGKTAFAVSLACQPGGFLDQGANVHYIANEESAFRTKIRGFSCYSGFTKEEIAQDKAKATQAISKIRGQWKMVDAVAWDLSEVEAYIMNNKIDILIIDQLDKIRLPGSYAKETDRIRELYTYTRELAKKYHIAILGVCQASNDAEGKLYYGFECLENSKTGKAAEVDLCICIGKESYEAIKGEDSGFRMANIVKNKLTGKETSVAYMLNRDLARITA